jgi:phage-related protein (TIGR01555 family)
MSETQLQSTFASAMTAAKARLDGWLNVTLGLGGSRDVRSETQFRPTTAMSPQMAMGLFMGNDLARLICSFKPGLALKNKWEVCIEDDDPREQAIHMRIEELRVTPLVLEAAIWGLCTGGGILLLGIDDGRQPWEPVETDLEGNPQGIRRINFIKAFDRRAISRVSEFNQDPTDPRFGEPSLYSFNHRMGAQYESIQVHASRVIVFPGVLTGDFEKLANAYWDYSILDAVYDVLREFGLAWADATRLLHDASQGVYAVKDLMAILESENGEVQFQKRMRTINYARNNASALVIDADGERFEKVATTFAGVPDMLDRLFNRLAAAARIPVTMLAGQAPAGLNATGKSDLEIAYGDASIYQRDVIRPRLRHLVRLLLAEGGQQEPQMWRLEFAPIDPQQGEKDAALRKTVAETDQIYLNSGVLTSSNVALDRFGPDGWSMETSIDTALYEQLEQGENALLVEGGANNKDLGTVGAQVDAIGKIITQVAQGTISQDTAIAQVTALFGLSEDVARSMIGDVTVTPVAPPLPKAPPPSPPPAAPPPASAPLV